MIRARLLVCLVVGVCFLVVGCGGMPSPASPASQPGSAAVSSTGDDATSTAAPGLASSPTRTPPDWPTYHGNGARTGVASGFPALRGSLAKAWSATLDGAVYGEPLGVGGRVIVATEGDSVYALDPANGRVLWRRHLGTPVSLSSLPCGNIDPLGVTSTPAYDRSTGSLFVVAEVAGPRHVLFALSAATGAVRWSRSVDLPGDDPLAHQQRAALALGNGYVYIGFGGLAGDCGAYRGEVVGVPVTGHGATIAYRVPVAREGAVWAAGGPVLDAHGNVYVSIGNGSSTSTYDGSDAVVELSPALRLRSRFAPSQWAQDNANDADLGSLSPVLVPGGWVFIAGKSGIGYVLRQGALGGIGGEVTSRAVCAAFGGVAQSGSTIYVPCADGLRMIQVGSGGSIRLGWHTSSGATGPPVIVGGAVWSVAPGNAELQALSPSTGAVLARIGVGSVPHFASPTPWDGLVLVGTMTGVTAIRADNQPEIVGRRECDARRYTARSRSWPSASRSRSSRGRAPCARAAGRSSSGCWPPPSRSGWAASLGPRCAADVAPASTWGPRPGGPLCGRMAAPPGRRRVSRERSLKATLPILSRIN